MTPHNGDISSAELVGQVTHEWIRQKEAPSPPMKSDAELTCAHLRLTRQRLSGFDGDSLTRSRLRTWVNPEEKGLSELVTARVMSGSLTFATHYLRYMRYMQSSTASDYNQRQGFQPDNIDFDVAARSQEYFEEFDSIKKTPQIISSLHALFPLAVQETVMSMMVVRNLVRFSPHDNLGKDESEAVTLLNGISATWLRFGVGCIARAHRLYNGLEDIPFLPPESEQNGVRHIFPFKVGSSFWPPNEPLGSKLPNVNQA